MVIFGPVITVQSWDMSVKVNLVHFNLHYNFTTFTFKDHTLDILISWEKGESRKIPNFTFCIATALQQLGNCFSLSLCQFHFLHSNSLETASHFLFLNFTFCIATAWQLLSLSLSQFHFLHSNSVATAWQLLSLSHFQFLMPLSLQFHFQILHSANSDQLPLVLNDVNIISI